MQDLPWNWRRPLEWKESLANLSVGYIIGEEQWSIQIQEHLGHYETMPKETYTFDMQHYDWYTA